MAIACFISDIMTSLWLTLTDTGQVASLSTLRVDLSTGAACAGCRVAHCCMVLEMMPRARQAARIVSVRGTDILLLIAREWIDGFWGPSPSACDRRESDLFNLKLIPPHRKSWEFAAAATALCCLSAHQLRDVALSPRRGKSASPHRRASRQRPVWKVRLARLGLGDAGGPCSAGWESHAHPRLSTTGT